MHTMVYGAARLTEGFLGQKSTTGRITSAHMTRNIEYREWSVLAILNASRSFSRKTNGFILPR